MDLLELQLHRTVGSVTRRIPRSPAVVDLVMETGSLPSGAVLPLSGRASLRVDTPFHPVPPELRSWGWRAHLRLRWARPTLVAEPVVGAELSAWSTTTTELLLVPLVPQALRWSQRRWDRYFDLAHAAADALVAHITSTRTGLPASPPYVLQGFGSAQN
jgi:hypothetical protein